MKNENNTIIFEEIKESINKKNNDINLLKKYIIDIRNLKKLDTEMINNISNMSINDIIIILNTYNDVTDAFSKFIENFK